MYCKEELKKLELYCEKDDDDRVAQYFLRAEYEVLTDHRKKKVVIDKILLLIRCPDIRQELSTERFPYTTIDFGFGELQVTEPIKEIILEEYPQKMTLKEIEKKLGYRVEIVSE